MHPATDDPLRLLAQVFGGFRVVTADQYDELSIAAWNAVVPAARPVPLHGPPGAAYSSRGKRLR